MRKGLIGSVPLPIAIQWFYLSVLAAGILAAPKAAQALDSQTALDLETARKEEKSVVKVPALQTVPLETMTPVEAIAKTEPPTSPPEPPLPELPDPENPETDPMEQVTSVTQLRDIQPTDWAFEALRSLVERYGCIAGYPDSTFRGNRAISRYEFAAGLNACFSEIERKLANRGEVLSQQDLKTLQRLLDEFSSELATLKTRVDHLEEHTAVLQEHQFSTTTKLFGQAVIGVQGRTNNQSVAPFFPGIKTRDPQTNINLITNTQLSLFTQLSPRSILLTGLQAGSGFTGGLNPTFTKIMGLKPRLSKTAFVKM